MCINIVCVCARICHIRFFCLTRLWVKQHWETTLQAPRPWKECKGDPEPDIDAARPICPKPHPGDYRKSADKKSLPPKPEGGRNPIKAEILQVKALEI